MGMGSREHVLGADVMITCLTITSVTVSNVDRVYQIKNQSEQVKQKRYDSPTHF